MTLWFGLYSKTYTTTTPQGDWWSGCCTGTAAPQRKTAWQTSYHPLPSHEDSSKSTLEKNREERIRWFDTIHEFGWNSTEWFNRMVKDSLLPWIKETNTVWLNLTSFKRIPSEYPVYLEGTISIADYIFGNSHVINPITALTLKMSTFDIWLCSNLCTFTG